jgi:hypothetical protein
LPQEKRSGNSSLPGAPAGIFLSVGRLLPRRPSFLSRLPAAFVEVEGWRMWMGFGFVWAKRQLCPAELELLWLNFWRAQK